MDNHPFYPITATITMKSLSNTLQTEKQLRELWQDTFDKCLGISLGEHDITADIFPPCASTHRDDPPVMYPQSVTINLQYSSMLKETPEEIAEKWIRTFRNYIGWPLSLKDIRVQVDPPKHEEPTIPPGHTNTIWFPLKKKDPRTAQQ